MRATYDENYKVNLRLKMVSEEKNEIKENQQ